MSNTLRPPPPPFSKLDTILDKLEELAVSDARIEERVAVLPDLLRDVADLRTEVEVLKAIIGERAAPKVVGTSVATAGGVSALVALIPEILKLLKGP